MPKKAIIFGLLVLVMCLVALTWQGSWAQQAIDTLPPTATTVAATATPAMIVEVRQPADQRSQVPPEPVGTRVGIEGAAVHEWGA